MSDHTHCGVDGFSPPAPDCDTNTIPEPGTLLLLLLALVIWRALRALRTRYRNQAQGSA